MNNMGIFQVVLGLLILAMVPHSSATFCVCKPGLQSAAYQKAIDYACGAGADCSPIRPNGQCYNPNSIQEHCSYATNSYYQKNAAKGATCDFQGTATPSSSDPSSGGCSFSASSGSSGSTSTGTTSPGTSPVTTVPTTSPTTPTSTPVSGGGGTVPVTPVSGAGTPTYGTGTGTGTSSPTSGTGTGMGTGTNPTTTSPYGTTPNVGNPTTGTGVLGGGGLGMGPTGSNLDDNHGIKLASISLWSALVALMVSGIMSM